MTGLKQPFEFRNQLVVERHTIDALEADARRLLAAPHAFAREASAVLPAGPALFTGHSHAPANFYECCGSAVVEHGLPAACARGPIRTPYRSAE